ncbi:MAG: DEAD/DEAH box helicase family protein, partial [Methanospirillaceae archaeon]|nr:DEAD/DEAH box helicase family protein [Methanospirillaceae archaeon]
MKLQFKHQQFQVDAAWAVCDVFAGQPNQSPDYRRDIGVANPSDYQYTFGTEGVERSPELDEIGYKNNPIGISESTVLDNIQRVQRTFNIKPSEKLEGKYNLTIEMETGVGKTYTYTKTMYELNARYGFTKFIIVVPSVAIREGVYKSLQLTDNHFAEEYGKKIRYFIYNSRELHRIDQYAQDSGINVMVINSQAFNARGKDARRIDMQLDSFRSRRPIDVIAAVHPIIIIDEPQSVEGPATRERLQKFKPLFTLRYSATHKQDQIYNQVYRLDALDAYNQQLVKKIAVKGISVSGSTGTEGYLYLNRLIVSPKTPPKATLEIEMKGQSGIFRKMLTVSEGFNLFEKSGELEQYKGHIVAEINGLTNSVRFTNGNTISTGEVQGIVNEEQIRRIQIRETITAHLEREQALFYQGIKVLTLFFIDEVAKYRIYNDTGEAQNGEYAD